MAGKSSSRFPAFPLSRFPAFPPSHFPLTRTYRFGGIDRRILLIELL